MKLFVFALLATGGTFLVAYNTVVAAVVGTCAAIIGIDRVYKRFFKKHERHISEPPKPDTDPSGR